MQTRSCKHALTADDQYLILSAERCNRCQDGRSYMREHVPAD